MKFTFEKATKEKARARVALVGPAGSGKTYTALRVATGIAGPDGRIAVIDTENGSARKYADRFQFDVLELDHFAPRTYVQAIGAAVDAGYTVVVVDSLSHAWIGKGGALEQVDQKAKGGNSFAAWRHVTPQHNELVDALVRCGAHLIVTMRAKTEYIIEQDKRGKSVPRKVGLAPVQRDGLEYEFDVVCDIDHDHTLTVSKSRCSDIADEVIQKPDARLGERLRAWLSDGVTPEDAPRPVEPSAPSTPPTAPPAAPGPQQAPRSNPVAEAAEAAIAMLAGELGEEQARKRMRAEVEKVRDEREPGAPVTVDDVKRAHERVCESLKSRKSTPDSDDANASQPTAEPA